MASKASGLEISTNALLQSMMDIQREPHSGIAFESRIKSYGDMLTVYLVGRDDRTKSRLLL